MGHSMGGGMCGMFAATFPECVDRLVMLDFVAFGEERHSCLMWLSFFFSGISFSAREAKYLKQRPSIGVCVQFLLLDLGVKNMCLHISPPTPCLWPAAVSASLTHESVSNGFE